MSLFEIAVLFLLFLIWGELWTTVRAIRRSIISASDINLEAQNKLLDEIRSALQRIDCDAKLERVKSDPDS